MTLKQRAALMVVACLSAGPVGAEENPPFLIGTKPAATQDTAQPAKSLVVPKPKVVRQRHVQTKRTSTPDTSKIVTGTTTKKNSAADPKAQDKVAAKRLFGHKRTAAQLKPQAFGFYSRGCLAGGMRLAINGPAWQAMRLSRNRNWGHPKLVSVVQRLAIDAKLLDGWPGLLVGDMAQPRGGPMLTGHRSHQIGLDADIWFTPMPARRLTWRERERTSAISMLAKGHLSVNPKIWTDTHVRLIRRAASFPEVERILVHPAIKKALCEGSTKIDGSRLWLAKVRPYWGHHYHFHLRIGCPPDSPGCRRQKPTTGDLGCTKELDYWYRLMTRPRPKRPKRPRRKRKPRPPMTIADLHPACRGVLNAKPSLTQKPAPVKRSGGKAQ